MPKRLRDMSRDELRAWWVRNARKLGRGALENYYVEHQMRPPRRVSPPRKDLVPGDAVCAGCRR